MLQTTARSLLAVLVLVLLTGHLGTPIVDAWHPNTAHALNESGLRFHVAGDIASAIETFRQAIEKDPFVAEYHFNLSVAYNSNPLAVGQLMGMAQPQVYEAMLEESFKARVLNPDDRELARAYAWNCLAFEDFGASPNWEGALNAWRHLSSFHDRERDTAGNLPDKVAPVHELLQMARIQLELGRTAEARELIETALSILPESRLALLLLERC